MASSLSEAERARIEKNRQKAYALRASKIKTAEFCESDGKKVFKVNGDKFIDTHGGSLINQRDKEQDEEEREAKLAKLDEGTEVPLHFFECIECHDQVAESYLMTNFALPTCDGCKNLEEKHLLMTKSDAKSEYLLKDCDMDKREPILKFISRKNPHKSSWAEMKLYLHSQVLEKALQVWGSMEKIEEEKVLREDKKEIGKVKKYNKELKKLRMNVRSTLYDKTTATHTHEFGEEVFVEEDTYSRTCIECSFVETYEKI